MSVQDPITEALMSPGAPFEVVSQMVRGRELRVFRHAPETLVAILIGHGLLDRLISWSQVSNALLMTIFSGVPMLSAHG